MPNTKATSNTKNDAVLNADMYVSGILSGNRAKLARAITLIESRNSEHQILAQEILIKLLPQTGKSLRIGVSGLPGSGKSTFIDAFGTMLTAAGRKVAVLAVDPTSSRTGGSILGDKTRMAQLAVDPEAFIRPSPTSGTLGGVAHATREAILLCEAAGYNVILVETVGVGQSEITVSEMVDFFLVLMIAGGGDELQGIKKGVLEIADMIAITKSDGDNTSRAAITAADYQHALRIITPNNPNWVPPVITISAQDNNGLDVLWNKIDLYHTSMQKSGEWASKRRSQQIRWMWSMVDDRLKRRLKADPKIKAMIPDLEKEVGTGRLIPTLAVDKIFSTFGV